jgi:GNAT superfamily N-acetyltransferase
MKLTPARVRFEVQPTQQPFEGGNRMLTNARPGPRTETDAATTILGPAVLRDGSVLAVRRLTERDRGELARFYLGLSPRTLFLRFMSPVPRLPESTLAYLSDTGIDREVVVATCGDAIVAEGRYHRVLGTNDAEVALVVADAWQGRGIGPMLTERLARIGRLRGVEAFCGSMLADNDHARSLLGVQAPGATRRIRWGELEFRTPLPDSP